MRAPVAWLGRCIKVIGDQLILRLSESTVALTVQCHDDLLRAFEHDFDRAQTSTGEKLGAGVDQRRK